MKKHTLKGIQIALLFVLLLCSVSVAEGKSVLTDDERKAKTAKLLEKLHKNFDDYKELVLNNGLQVSMMTKQMSINNNYLDINRLNEAPVVEADIIMVNNDLLFNDFANALKILERSLQYNPENIELLLSEAKVYFISKRYDDVVGSAYKILKIAPTNVDALMYASIANRYLKKYDESLKDADKVVEIYRSTGSSNTARGYTAKTETYLALGIANSSNEYTNKALENINKAIEIEPNIYRYNIRFAIYDATHKYDDALKDLNEIAKLDPSSKTLFGKARYLAKVGKYEESIEAYSKVIAIDPKESNAYLNRGMVYRNIGKMDEAIADYEKTISINPKDEYVYLNLGYAYELMGKYDKAIKYYKKQEKNNPKVHSVYLNEAGTYILMGNFKKAYAAFQTFTDFNKDQNKILKSTFDKWNEILVKNPDDPYVKKIQGMLIKYEVVDDSKVNKFDLGQKE